MQIDLRKARHGTALALVASALLLAPSIAWSQGGVSTTTGASPGDDAPVVDIGAGSTSAVTTGSSGGKTTVSPANDAKEPARVAAPEGENGFRCSRISDPTAQEMCEARTRELQSPADLWSGLVR